MATETVTYVPGVTELRENEIWQDDEGCLYTPAGPTGSGWLAFGAERVLHDVVLEFWFPLTKVVDHKGNVLVESLNYSEEIKNGN